MANQMLNTISRDPAMRESLRKRKMWELDRQHEQIMATRKGIKQGIKQGIGQVALNMLRRGKSISEISEDTGLSPEEIASIK